MIINHERPKRWIQKQRTMIRNNILEVQWSLCIVRISHPFLERIECYSCFFVVVCEWNEEWKDFSQYLYCKEKWSLQDDDIYPDSWVIWDSVMGFCCLMQDIHITLLILELNNVILVCGCWCEIFHMDLDWQSFSGKSIFRSRSWKWYVICDYTWILLLFTSQHSWITL